MRGEKKEKWMALCEQAANEQDPEKLMALVAEIIRCDRQNLPAIPSRGVHCEGITVFPRLTRVLLGWLLETRVFLSPNP
jgi:hypothetical protein